jgi:hypothetical protein
MAQGTYHISLVTFQRIEYLGAADHPWPEPLPTPGQQTGNTSDGWSEADADGPAPTPGGSLVRPPPVVMWDNSRSSLGYPYERSLSSTSWSTPPPVYTR